jgi:DNA-binding MarR family transcriptional regulator
MVRNIDVREIAGCTCLKLRRTTRRISRIYDRALQPTGLTISQFGLLAHLHGAQLAGHDRLAIGALAELVGADPTTLNRNLKPLQVQGLIADKPDPADLRVRGVYITAKGHARLARAVPFWRQAQTRVETAIGGEAAASLRGLLDAAASSFPS